MKVGSVLVLLAASACAAVAQSDNNDGDKPQPQRRGVWDEPIRFATKSKDACTMVVSGASDYTRLRVSCKGPASRSYYCDFQGKPNTCRAYNLNPRHYFTQMMWELRKLPHACQGAKLYRPPMCKKHPDEVQMTFLSAWPRAAKPAKAAPAATQKPQKAGGKAQPGRAVPAPVPAKKTTPKPARSATARPPTEAPDSKASRMADEYCWKSLRGICAYVIGWFKN